MRWLLCLALAAVACNDKAAAPEVPATAGMTEKLVDALVAGDHGRDLRVRGTIEGPITSAGTGAQRAVMFGLVHGARHLRVVHRGVLPVRFAVGSEAAVDGRWFDADDATPVLEGHGFGSATPGEVFAARDVLAYGPSF